MRRPDVDWNTADIQAAVEGCYQVNPCVKAGGEKHKRQKSYLQQCPPVGHWAVGQRGVEPTWGVEQHHVLPSVDAALLGQRRRNLLRPLVQLHTGGRAHCHPLEDGNNKTPLSQMERHWHFSFDRTVNCDDYYYLGI